MIRTFTEGIGQKELIWHRDKKDRYVKVVSGEKWQLQFEDKMPKEMVTDSTYFIPKMTYHRLIKGKGVLIVEIEEKQENT